MRMRSRVAIGLVFTGVLAVFGPAISAEPHQPYSFCQNPDAFLLWDGIHPTRAVHGIIADRIAMLLAAQPSLQGSPQR
jgi:phospholipase/lecithinase/hemolysin